MGSVGGADEGRTMGWTTFNALGGGRGVLRRKWARGGGAVEVKYSPKTRKRALTAVKTVSVSMRIVLSVSGSLRPSLPEKLVTHALAAATVQNAEDICFMCV